MKRVMLAMLIGLFCTATFAQSKETDNEKKEKQPVVPAEVTQAFAKEFPGKKATWDSEDGGFEAEFKLNGIDASATYNKAGHRESLEIAIKTEELPATAMEYVKKNYPLHKITEAAKITTDKNVVTYEIEVGKNGKSLDVIFDANGKFIKQEESD